jgi:hypothetical protein
MDSALEIPQLTRTEEYDDPAVLTMPDHSWLARTTADMCDHPPAEEINDKAYWADVFGNNWEAKAPENNKAAAEEEFDAILEELEEEWLDLIALRQDEPLEWGIGEDTFE